MRATRHLLSHLNEIAADNEASAVEAISAVDRDVVIWVGGPECTCFRAHLVHKLAWRQLLGHQVDVGVAHAGRDVSSVPVCA